MENLLLNVVFLSPFVGIAKIWQGSQNQNNTLLDYYIIHMCISQHTVRLGYKPSSITKF
jgi:hypothetical protein